jgi:Ca2+-binding RTX toxin-like protein
VPTQKTNVSGDIAGISYSAPGLTWKINKGVKVSGNGFGVESQFANSKLVNSGKVTGGEAGAFFNVLGGRTVVDNKKSGTLESGSSGTGLFISDPLGSAQITNAGKISGAMGAYVFTTSDVTFDNQGSIKAIVTAIMLPSLAAGSKNAVIQNHGKIDGGNSGIYAAGADGVSLKVVNHKGATIQADFAAIVSLVRLDLKNDGKIKGYVASLATSDKVINKGSMGDVSLGGGNDVYKAKGKGKAGMIDLGEGNDLAVLGKKADKLLFDSALNAATNVDTVKKFKSGKDKFYLDEDIFTGIAPGKLQSSAFHQGTQAKDADDRIIYDKKTGALYYDPDGAGGVAQTKFAQLDKGTKLKASDFMVGEYSLFP